MLCSTRSRSSSRTSSPGSTADSTKPSGLPQPCTARTRARPLRAPKKVYLLPTTHYSSINTSSTDGQPLRQQVPQSAGPAAAVALSEADQLLLSSLDGLSVQHLTLQYQHNGCPLTALYQHKPLPRDPSAPAMPSAWPNSSSAKAATGSSSSNAVGCSSPLQHVFRGTGLCQPAPSQAASTSKG
jgi:hypothetical protein